MVTMISGARDTLAINQDRRVVDISDRIALLEPNKTPLVVLLMKLRKAKAINPKVQWLEDELIPRYSSVDGAISAGDTSLAVATGEGQYFRTNDVVLNTITGEPVLVTGISTDTLTVTRNFRDTGSAAAMSDADELLILGNASAENSSVGTLKTTTTTTAYNYTEIFRTPYGASRTEMQSELYGGADRDYLGKKGGIEHLRDIEQSFWFGQRKEDSSGVRRACGGIESFISTNSTALGSAGLTASTLEDWVRTLFRYGNSTKFMFCSPLTLSKIQQLGIGSLQLLPTDQTFGLNITRYVSPHGNLNLVREVLFQDSGVYDEYSYGVDMENLEMKVMQDTIQKKNIQNNDVDGWIDEYLTEATIKIKLEKTHARLTNVGGSAVT